MVRPGGRLAAGGAVAVGDLDAGLLELGDTRIVVDGKSEDSDGKSESGRRTISLDPLTIAYLRRHLAMLDEERKAAMVSNLLVVLCGHSVPQPVVNTGTIYQ